MRSTLRKALADSHIAAVAIVILLIWALDSGARAIGPPVLSILELLITMVAIRGVPYGSGSFSLAYLISEIPTLTHILDAAISLGAAWVLARWVYKMGPCQSLIECRARLARRNHD